MFNVDNLTEEAAKNYLKDLIEKFDKLSCEDFLGQKVGNICLGMRIKKCHENKSFQ